MSIFSYLRKSSLSIHYWFLIFDCWSVINLSKTCSINWLTLILHLWWMPKPEATPAPLQFLCCIFFSFICFVKSCVELSLTPPIVLVIQWHFYRCRSEGRTICIFTTGVFAWNEYRCNEKGNIKKNPSLWCLQQR